MKYREQFERQVVREDVWIPTRDGNTRLHARVWRPVDADTDPVPALLEYLPYRKSDWTAPRDAQRHPGTPGTATPPSASTSAATATARARPATSTTRRNSPTASTSSTGWPRSPGAPARSACSASRGAASTPPDRCPRPEPLKAIVTVCSTDDRYDNDVHYTGGALLGIDMLAWAGTMLAFASRPPDPASVGHDRLLPMWRERLEALEPFLHTWLAHQRRDDYWRHGSVCEDYDAIDAAVLAVGGWHDPYRDTVLRLVEHLPGDRVRG